MNQQSTNSSSINNSSASSTLSSLVPPDRKPRPKEAATVDAPLPKALTRKSKSTVIASGRKAAAAKNPVKSEDRCRHYTATGRRCRLTVLDPASGLCFRHVGLQFQPTDEDLSPAFVGLLSGFQSASRIHDFLTQLTVLLVQNRISTRRAAILAYLGQTLLRTLPAINDELDPPEQKDEENRTITFDIDCAVARRAQAAQEAQRLSDGQRLKDPERAMVSRIDTRRVTSPVAPDGYDGYTSNPDKPK